MSLRFISCIVVFAGVLLSCKKADLTKPLSVTGTEIHTPANYNPDLYYTKTDVISSQGMINNITVNSSNSTEMIILGSFNYIQLTGGSPLYYSCMAKYNVTSGVLSKYPINLSSNYSDVYSIINGSNGKDYLGGFMKEVSSNNNVFLGVKTATASFFSSNAVNLNNSIYSMKESAGKIYFTGVFSYTVPFTSYCSPVLTYDMSNNSVSEFGTSMSNLSYNNKCLEIYNNKVYVGGGYGYIGCSSGGSWSIPGGGFNGYVEDLNVYDNKLYAAGNMTGYYSISGNLNYVNTFNEFTQVWEKVGINNLPSICKDIEWYNGNLYACGMNYIYKLDASDNKWKPVTNTTISLPDVRKIKFVNGKLYFIESSQWSGTWKIARLD